MCICFTLFTKITVFSSMCVLFLVHSTKKNKTALPCFSSVFLNSLLYSFRSVTCGLRPPVSACLRRESRGYFRSGQAASTVFQNFDMTDRRSGIEASKSALVVCAQPIVQFSRCISIFEILIIFYRIDKQNFL